MRRAVLGNPAAAALLRLPGRNEQAIRWVDPASGVKCRAKIDKLTRSGVVIDLKTTQDVSVAEFSKSAFNYGYDRQSAFYLRGAARLRDLGLFDEKLSDGEGHPFYLICVSKAVVPECVVFQPSERMVAIGDEANQRDLCRLRDCVDFGVWEPESHGKIVTLDMPPWARR